MSCDLPFDESDIAPELRRNNSSVDAPVEDSPSVNRTNLEEVDISIDASASGIPLTPPQSHYRKQETIDTTMEENRSQETIYNKTTEKGKTQEGLKDNLEETVSTAGGLQVPVITSPADIYKHFPRRVTFQDEIRERFSGTDTSSAEEIGGRENASDSDDQSSDENKERLPSNAHRTGTSYRGNTFRTMFSGEASEEAAAELLQSYQQTLNNLAQKMLVKDVRIDKFHGRDNEHISRWFEKLELLLTTKGIDKTGLLAIAQIINNLGGPAETFLFELPAEERESFEKLKNALMKRYATKDRTWVKRQRLITRRQGTNELLSDYINDMHELFSGLQVAEADKVTYFVEGLLPSLKVEVLKRMPETLLVAEECARTLDSINKRMSQTNENSQVERLINALMANGQVPAVATGTSSTPMEKQMQALTARMDVLTNKLGGVAPKEENKGQLAAYVEPERESQQSLTKLIRELKEDLRHEIQQRDRQVDARINGLARRVLPNRYESQQPRQRTRDGKPICFDCGNIGHVQQSCPYRRSRPIPNALPAPVTERQLVLRNNSYNPGQQSRHRELPSRRRERMAAFEDVEFQEESYEQYFEDYDIGELYYHNTNPQDLDETGYCYGEKPEGFESSEMAPISPNLGQVLKEATGSLASKTADNQDLMSPVYVNYPDRDVTSKPEFDWEQFIVPPPPSTTALLMGEIPIVPPPPPMDDLTTTIDCLEYDDEDDFEWPAPPPPITDTEEEANALPLLPPDNNIAVIEAEWSIAPPPTSTTALLVGGIPIALPPPLMGDLSTTIDYLDVVLPPPPEFRDDYEPPPLENEEPQLTSSSPNVVMSTTEENFLDILLLPPVEFRDDFVPSSQDVAIATTDCLPPTTAGCQVDIDAVDISVAPEKVDPLSADTKEAEPWQHPQKLSSTRTTADQTDKVDIESRAVPDELKEKSPRSFATQPGTKVDRGNPKIAVATDHAQKPHELTVPVQLNGKTTRFLVDTGASMSVIEYGHLQEMFDGNPILAPTSPSRAIQTVSGEQLPIVGRLTVTLNIAGGDYPCELKIIKGLTYKAVLGRDFLRAHGAVINLQTEMLELEEHPTRTHMEEMRSIHALSTYVISPRSEAVIPARIQGTVIPGTTGLVESAPRLAERYHLQGATSLVSVSPAETIPFRLINPTTKPVTLYKGATLGTFAETGEDLFIEPTGDVTEKRSLFSQRGRERVAFTISNFTQDQPYIGSCNYVTQSAGVIQHRKRNKLKAAKTREDKLIIRN